jgi:hypothetical protein
MSDTFAEAAGVDTGMETEDGEGLTVDLSNTSEKGNFEVVPRGIYPMMVSQLDFGRSQRSNNPMWTWIFEVEEGNEYAGRKFFYHTVFNEGGMPRVKRTLARIKDETGYAQTLLSTRFNPEAVANEGKLLGARCRVRVDIRVYNGEKRNDVKDVLPPQEGAAAGGGFAGV